MTARATCVILGGMTRHKIGVVQIAMQGIARHGDKLYSARTAERLVLLRGEKPAGCSSLGWICVGFVGCFGG